MLECVTCGTRKPTEGFYASDRRHCKECVRRRVRANRAAKTEYYRAYDRKRYREQEQRKLNARRCSKSIGVERMREYRKASKQKHPEKYKARNAVSNALRDGRLECGTECFFCGASERLQAHHPDYSHPLDVVWLCAPCHGKLHHVTGDLRRAG